MSGELSGLDAPISDPEIEEAWWCVNCECPLHLGDDPDGVPGLIDRRGESQCNDYPHFQIPIEWKDRGWWVIT